MATFGDGAPAYRHVIGGRFRETQTVAKNGDGVESGTKRTVGAHARLGPMKLFLVSPSFNAVERGQDATRPDLDEAVEMILRAIQPTGNERIIGVWHNNEASMGAEAFDAEYAGKRVKSLNDRDLLRSVLRRVADPWDNYFMWVRCQTTCRFVFFGCDAQAFLFLRHEDAPPSASPLVQVEERTAMLAETDFFDGQ